MKDLTKLKPGFLVSDEEFKALKDGTSHLFTIPLNKKNIQFLPLAYEDTTGTVLVFPMDESPKVFRFRTKGKESCEREAVNIMAYKQEDGSEIIKIRLK